MDRNKYFRTKSNLLLYRQAYWNPERIPDSEIRTDSFLALARIAQKRKFLDPVTGRIRFEETDLIERAKKEGAREEELMRLSSAMAMIQNEDKEKLLSVARHMKVPEGFTVRPPFHLKNEAPGATPFERDSQVNISHIHLLQLIQRCSD